MTAPLTIRLHPADNVVVARMDILPGTRVEGEIAAATRVPPGHKILTRAVKAGEPLAMVEAMKMENMLRAERDCTVKLIRAKEGDSLPVDAIIMEFG